MIRDVRQKHPDVIFLAEAFTRPKMMRRLAKIGFNQSYTYFTWRNTKAELTAYLTELSQSSMKEYYRPNFFVNTPDINPIPLQTAPRAGFIARAVLAGTLSPAWGMYAGFELCEATPLPGREEYLNSEKYEIRAWNWDRAGNIRAEIAALNRIRCDNPALHTLTNLRFHTAHHDQVLFYGKTTPARDNAILVAVCLDWHNAVDCAIEIPLHDLGLAEDSAVAATELLTGERVAWRGRHQRVRFDPGGLPCRIWRVDLT
jgi:starch synthase (maltosyl-transferring)